MVSEHQQMASGRLPSHQIGNALRRSCCARPSLCCKPPCLSDCPSQVSALLRSMSPRLELFQPPAVLAPFLLQHAPASSFNLPNKVSTVTPWAMCLMPATAAVPPPPPAPTRACPVPSTAAAALIPCVPSTSACPLQAKGEAAALLERAGTLRAVLPLAPDICVHWAVSNNYARTPEATFAGLEAFAERLAAVPACSLLLVSGGGPRRKLDSLQVRQAARSLCL